MGLVPTRDIDEETTGGDYLFAFNVVFFHPCTFSLFIQHLPHPILRPKQKNRPGQIKSARPPQPCLYIGRRSRLTGQIRRARLDLIKEKLSLFSIVPWWARKYRVGRAREWGPPLRRKKRQRNNNKEVCSRESNNWADEMRWAWYTCSDSLICFKILDYGGKKRRRSHLHLVCYLVIIDRPPLGKYTY